MSSADAPFVTGGTSMPPIVRVGSVLRVPVVDADPATGDDGEIVYDQVQDKFRSRVNGAWTDLGGGGGATAPVSTALRLYFVTGGSIAQWNGFPSFPYQATYLPSNGTTSTSGPFYPFVYSENGGDVTAHFEYESDVDVVVTPRIMHADGTLSTASTGTLPTADVAADITVTLAAGDSLGFHFAPSGGVVTYNYLKLFV